MVKLAGSRERTSNGIFQKKNNCGVAGLSGGRGGGEGWRKQLKFLAKFVFNKVGMIWGPGHVASISNPFAISPLNVASFLDWLGNHVFLPLLPAYIMYIHVHTHTYTHMHTAGPVLHW